MVVNRPVPHTKVVDVPPLPLDEIKATAELLIEHGAHRTHVSADPFTTTDAVVGRFVCEDLPARALAKDRRVLCVVSVPRSD